MNAVPVSPHWDIDPTDSAGLIATLANEKFPLALDWLSTDGRQSSRPAAGSVVAFQFVYDEVPFAAAVVRHDSRVLLKLTGSLGTLPFTIESASRRRRLGLVLAAARRSSGLRWAVTPRHEIEVNGEIELSQPLTPTAALSGAVALLLASRPYLNLMVEVGGES